MNDLTLYHISGPAAVITINRPDKRGALSRALITSLSDAFQRAADDPAARCVILTGSGPAFCAGMDLDELRGTLTAGEGQVWEDALRLSNLYDFIYKLPKPTIAAVNGAAIAGGAGLVSVCDLAFAVPAAKFGYPDVRRGLDAAMVMPYLLRHVGERMARFLLLGGEIIDADKACQCGLVNGIIQPESLMEESLKLAAACAEGGPKALAQTKQFLQKFGLQSASVE